MPPPDPSLSSGPPYWTEHPACPRLGRFLLGPELGRGGTGRVYEAWDPQLRRRVAIKRLRSDDPDQILALIQEARLQSRVRHPHVCQIHELSSDPEAPFIAMQLVEGHTLADLSLDLDVAEKVRLMADVAAAVHAAHQAGMVHRDLKPQNILVEALPQGMYRAIVADFGLARDWTQVGRTLTWNVSGTPAYMAPEQGRGESPTPACDLYSLGATCYALFTGFTPFEAMTVGGLLARHSGGEPPRLRRRIPDLPEDLETITAKAMDPEPARRYASAFEMEADLRRYLAGEPILARPTTLAFRCWRRVRRHRALAATLFCSVVAIGLLLGWNARTRLAGRRQAEWAARFGLEVKDLENLLRLERMLPPHDLRPAEARLEQGLARIRKEMATQGALAEGPGHYALGRAHLAQGDLQPALEALERAWAAGFHAPEAAYALGTAYARTFERELRGALRKNRSLQGAEQARKELFAKWGQPALDAFAKAHGQALDHPALGEAEVALVQGDLQLCIRKCQEAYGALPWLVEARRMEALALGHLRFQREQEGDSKEKARLEDEAWRTLEAALALAPSDEATLAAAIETMGYRTTRQSEAGGLSVEPFVRGEGLYEQALKIRPGHPQVLRGLVGLRYRKAVLMNCRGLDARPMLNQTIALAEPILDTHDDRNTLANAFWFLGTSQLLWGEDPRPSLAKARALYGEATAERAELSLVEARYLHARGQHPGEALDAALADLRLLLARQAGDAYLLQIQAEIHCLRAQWESEQGRDPSTSIQQGLASIDGAQRILPDIAYGWWDRAILQERAAAWAWKQGRDPAPALGLALQAAQRGLKLRPDHFRSTWALARVQLLKARIQASRGENPVPLLDEARKALAEGLSINPPVYLLLQLRAELECFAATAGDPSRAQVGEAAAQKGLRTKPDALALRHLLVEARRIQGR